MKTSDAWGWMKRGRALRGCVMRWASGVVAIVVLGGADSAAAQAVRVRAEPPQAQPCPAGVPADARCLVGRDYLGAGYWMAMPARWNGELVLHVRDHQLVGPPPRVDPPWPAPPADDLARWSVWLRAGYAWAGSTLRPDRLDTAAAVDDSERLRQAFIAEFGTPQFTWLHGHGWGAVAATRMAERHTTPDIDPRRLRGPTPSGGGTVGKPPYDGLLLTNGQLAGVRSDDLTLDARVVYQAVCDNHPRPDEPPYPLWMGLPLQAQMSPEALARRIDACTGLGHPAAQRSPAQQRALARITGTLGVAEDALPALLGRATWQFQAMVWRRLDGRSAWGNEGVRYRGDDAALQARIARVRADPTALARLDDDLAPGTRLHLPVLSLHAMHDDVVVVEQEAEFRQLLDEAGTAAQLLQLFTDDTGHAYGQDAQVLAAAAALRDWVQRGTKPTPADVAARCAALEARWQPATGCRLRPDYHPAVLETRVPQRHRERAADAPGAATAPAPAALPVGGRPAPPAAPPTSTPPPARDGAPGEASPRPTMPDPFDRPGTFQPG